MDPAICSRTLSMGSAPGLGRSHTESTMPWTTSWPWDSAISIVRTRMSRAYALIASWHSMRPKRALEYPVYPKTVVRPDPSLDGETRPCAIHFEAVDEIALRSRLPDAFHSRGEEARALSIDARVPEERDAIPRLELRGLFQFESAATNDITRMVLGEQDLVVVRETDAHHRLGGLESEEPLNGDIDGSQGRVQAEGPESLRSRPRTRPGKMRIHHLLDLIYAEFSIQSVGDARVAIETRDEEPLQDRVPSQVHFLERPGFSLHPLVVASSFDDRSQDSGDQSDSARAEVVRQLGNGQAVGPAACAIQRFRRNVVFHHDVGIQREEIEFVEALVETHLRLEDETSTVSLQKGLRGFEILGAVLLPQGQASVPVRLVHLHRRDGCARREPSLLLRCQSREPRQLREPSEVALPHRKVPAIEMQTPAQDVLPGLVDDFPVREVGLPLAFREPIAVPPKL